jgi:hypothetical protein
LRLDALVTRAVLPNNVAICEHLKGISLNLPGLAAPLSQQCPVRAPALPKAPI